MVVIADRPRRSKFLAADEAHAQASALVEEQYQNFDVVWAKLGSFPWWPGVLFFSWDAVNESGLDLKQTQQQLPIPPPTLHTLPDGKQRLVFSVLIMFLDRFNCSVIEVTPKTVCPFAINYLRLKDKHKGKSGFKIALGRAMRLLHMNDHMTVDELDAIAPIRAQPTEEELWADQQKQQQQLTVRANNGKRQKRTHASHAASKDDLNAEDIDEDDVDDEEEDEASLESDYTDGEQEIARKKSAKSPKKKGTKVGGNGMVSTPPSKKGSLKAPQRILDLSAGGKKPKSAHGKQTGKYKSNHRAEAIDDDDGESDFEIVSSSVKAVAKPMSSRKKASRKEGRTHHDVIHVDEDDNEDLSGDFEMSIVQPSSKIKRQGSSKSKSAKLTKGQSDHDIPEPLKQKKKKKRDSDVGVVPASKAQKKKGAKHHHDKSLGSTETSRLEPESRQEPLTLTPLSAIWTKREASDNVETDESNSENFARLAYRLDLLWDETLFTDESPGPGSSVEMQDAAEAISGVATSNNERGAGKRQVRSVQQSQIRQSMLTGNLDPHTMVQCASYVAKGGVVTSIEAGGGRSRGAPPQVEAPFDVVVHPDVVFVCDLHSHLATCEIIGFLGGRWDDATKTLYIQAAFPCRSLEIEGDDGSTDVEMDPGSEIELREIIQNAELEVVGWYHSHPAFAPDPSIRDIENQTSYQQLFQRPKLLEGGKTEISYPFVGLIVGTYDQRRESPVGLFRYFHTREERLNSGMRGVVYMPYELVPRKRHYRSVLNDEKRNQVLRLPIYASVAEILFGAGKVCFVKNPGFPSDAKDVLVPKGGVVREDHASAPEGGRKKKRKGSADLERAGKDEVIQPLSKKKRRGPKPAKIELTTLTTEAQEVVEMHKVATTAAVAVDPNVGEVTLVPEVVDLVTDASQDLSQSQDQPTSSSQLDGVSSDQLTATASRDSIYSTQDSGDATCSQNVSMQDTSVASLSPRQETNLVDAKDAPVMDGNVDPNVTEDSSYDASQSQNTSESHSSQPEEMIVDPCTRHSNIVDDYYAGVDIIEPSKPSFNEQSSKDVDINSPLRDGSTIDNPTRQKDSISEKGYLPAGVIDEVAHEEPSLTKRDTSAESPALRDEIKDHATTVMQDVVGESESDIAGHSIDCDEQKERSPDIVVEQAPTEDESSLNSAIGGSSNPVDVSMLTTGRRRTRKPSLTIRRHSGSTASPAHTNISPAGNSTFELEEGGNTNTITARAEITASAVSSTGPPVEDRKASVDSSWDGMVLISQEDYLEETQSLEAEPTVLLPHVERQNSTVDKADKPISPVVAIGEETQVVEVGKVSEPKTIMSKADVDEHEFELVKPHASEENIKMEADPVITQLKEIPCAAVEADAEVSDTPTKIGVKDEMHQDEALVSDGPVPDQKSVPNHSVTFLGEDVPVHNDRQELKHTSRSKPRKTASGGEKKAKTADPDFAVLLSEPLEQYGVKVVRHVYGRLHITHLQPPEVRNKKEGYIAAIRAYWRQQQLSTSADQGGMSGDPTSGVADCKILPSYDDSQSGDVTILDETKDAVQSLVVSVESLATDEAASVPTLAVPVVTNGQGSIGKTNQNVKPPGDSTDCAPHELVTVKAIATDPAAVLDPAGTSAHMKAKPSKLRDQHAAHLQTLRTNYGLGARGCTEQVITLIDYYRDFHRRTELYESWKGKILKVDKIEASLRADVEHVNVPVALRDAFIKDVMGYLRASWKLSGSAMQ